MFGPDCGTEAIGCDLLSLTSSRSFGSVGFPLDDGIVDVVVVVDDTTGCRCDEREKRDR
jgi:hypothetical protein